MNQQLSVERDRVAGAVQSAQLSFMVALGSIADAHNALVGQLQQQSETTSKDSTALSSNIQTLDARLQEVTSSFQHKLDAQASEHKLQSEQSTSRLQNRQEELFALLKSHIDA